jgi:isoleucyl-tRNA synthetase
MDDYNARRSTIALEAFVEDLSNWYVRRSRRRFWEGDAAALDTLYAALVTLTRLLAPFIPFTAEAMYQNLVRRGDTDAPESVHHTRWPKAPELDESDERLLRDMALVVRLAALGRSARATSNVKLRQPLASATVAVRTSQEVEAVRRLGRHLTSELNVKTLEVVRDEGSLVRYSVRPVLPKLGPKYGRLVPAIRAALEAADESEVARQVMAGEPVSLVLDGESVELLPDEIEVMASAREGLATAEEDGYVVGISTELTEELLQEGLARDVVRAVQQLRKDSGLDITDRIELAIEAPADVALAVEAWRDYVAGETLAEVLELAPPSGAMSTTESEIGGQSVRLGVRKV